MLLDETCFFLAVDFDKSGWLEDSTRLHRDLPSDGYSRRARAVTLWPRRARLALL